jgi:hypothetical protein
LAIQVYDRLFFSPLDIKFLFPTGAPLESEWKSGYSTDSNCYSID